jgi:subtilisin family serine protease
MTHQTAALVCGLASLLGACGPRASISSIDAATSPSGTGEGALVAVLDDGFDPTAPLLQNRIAGYYRLACPTDKADDAPSPLSADLASAHAYDQVDDAQWASEAADALADDAQRQPAPCEPREVPPAEYRTPPDVAKALQPFLSLREAWNAAVGGAAPLRPTLERYRDLASAISDLQSSQHGTLTASLVATLDPAARLVLIENPRVASTDDEIQAAYARYLCRDDRDRRAFQRQVDRIARFYARPDVRARAAAAAGSKPAAASPTTALLERLGVRLVNASLGSISPGEILQLCPGLALAELLRVVDSYPASAPEETRYLLVQSAGNAGQRIDRPQDADQCDGSPTRLLVGALDQRERDGREVDRRSTFSNYGRCVGLYALGQDIRLAGAMGFLSPFSGTSAAAPIVTGFLSRFAATAPTARDLRAVASRVAAPTAIGEQEGSVPVLPIKEWRDAYARLHVDGGSDTWSAFVKD